MTIIGILFIVLGLGGSGYVAWQLFGDPLMDPAAAKTGINEVKQEWDAQAEADDGFASAKEIPGKAIGLLRIPDIDPTFEVPIVYGTDNAALAKGIGWHEDTAKPGEKGNFVLAGHRGSRGPFVKLPDLMPGAKVEVETRDAVYHYVLDNHPADLVVQDTDVWILDPVPGKPANTQPTEAKITLYTCAKLFHAPDRAVAQGHLVNVQKKKA